MKKVKLLTAFMVTASLVFNAGCATVLGGRIDHCQRVKGDSGTPVRHIRWAAFAFDLILFPGPIINLGVDFLTGAIYKPCEYYSNPTSTHGAQTQSANGQNSDVVYLKDGSIIKGTIIEQIPNVSIKIKTKDGNVFNYKMEQIEKIAKE